jgi:hypothetical protein
MAAGSTYTPIATTTLGSAQNSITFTSFSGYTDLICVLTMTRSSGGENLGMRLNSDTGTNYSETYIEGDGSTAVSGRNSNTNTMRIAAIQGGLGTGLAVITIQLQNYSNSSIYKTVLTRYSQAGTIVGSSVGLWRNTNAITSLELGFASANFTTGTTATLYGIAAA